MDENVPETFYGNSKQIKESLYNSIKLIYLYIIYEATVYFQGYISKLTAKLANKCERQVKNRNKQSKVSELIFILFISFTCVQHLFASFALMCPKLGASLVYCDLRNNLVVQKPQKRL